MVINRVISLSKPHCEESAAGKARSERREEGFEHFCDIISVYWTAMPNATAEFHDQVYGESRVFNARGSNRRIVFLDKRYILRAYQETGWIERHSVMIQSRVRCCRRLKRGEKFRSAVHEGIPKVAWKSSHCADA